MEKLLSDCIKKKEYKVKNLDGLDASTKKRLTDIGLVCGEKISILKTNFGAKSFFVKVGFLSFAIDKSIAEKVVVCE